MKDVIYVIKAGDTIYNIADRFNITWQNLSLYNNLFDPNRLTIGSNIIIPPQEYSGW